MCARARVCVTMLLPISAFQAAMLAIYFIDFFISFALVSVFLCFPSQLSQFMDDAKPN